jgi:hypothetical protein
MACSTGPMSIENTGNIAGIIRALWLRNPWSVFVNSSVLASNPKQRLRQSVIVHPNQKARAVNKVV